MTPPLPAMLGHVTSAEPPLRVLVVDDEPTLASLVADELSDEGYDVGLAPDAATAWLVLMAEPVPDLVVLDWSLPDLDGPDLCQRMRDNGIKIPVLMLTGHDDVRDRVRALDAGVDDYLVKPFAVEELLARLRALRRRRWAAEREQPDAILQLSDLQVNLSQNEVFRNGTKLALSAMEHRLLLELLRGEGRPFSAEHLLQAVWGEGHQGDPMLLDVYAESLMAKIDAGRPEPLLQRLHDGGFVIQGS